MKIYREMDNFEELYNMAWSGAVDTLNIIIKNDKEDELMYLLEDTFEEASETEINDFLRFEDEYIFECLGINEEEEEE